MNLSQSASFLTLLAIALPGSAQTAAPAPAAGTRPAVPEAAVTLTPFEVVADAGDTYDATNTNSITGTNTALNRTPLDAKVFNRGMMDELAVVDTTTLLSDVAGLGPPLISGGSENVRGMLEGDRVDFKALTSRGLAISNPRREGFLRSEISLVDSFDLERVEALQGSNSLLFGSGDAGGVVNVSAKRAYLNRISAKIGAQFDSEGSERYTFDGNIGTRLLALRVNAVKGETKLFRPILGHKNEGLHLATTLQPLKRVTLRAEYRHLVRNAVLANGGTLRANPAVRMSNGELLDNQSLAYLMTVPGVTELTGGTLSLVTNDSAFGVYRRDNYTHEVRAVTLETALTDRLAFQLSYAHDTRQNDGLSPSASTVFTPDAPGNLYRDENGQLGRAWALNTTFNNPNGLRAGSRGYRATVAYQRNLGRWGSHAMNAFVQDVWSWQSQTPMRFYELDGNGGVIQDFARIATAESGRNAMPAVWVKAFPTALTGGGDWPVNVVHHPNGRTYKYLPIIYPGAVAATAANPLGVSGPIGANGASTSTAFYRDDTRETGAGFSLFSRFWRGRIDTMVGARFEEADTIRRNTLVGYGPVNFDSLTTGVVFDTPVKGLRGYVNYATNAKINFSSDRDIYNQPLPSGEGVSREAGLKFDLWEGRLSGNASYYVSEARNFTASLGSLRDDIDPDGINGRNGGGSYLYSKTADGFGASLSVKATRNWEIRLNYANADGSERTNVRLPVFYNDEFNTMTSAGAQVVAVKAAGGSLSPLMVPSNPAVPNSAMIPLSVAMLRDRNSPYFASLDAVSGQILNADTLFLRTPGVGTGRTGLGIGSHQLGFTPPADSLVVRRAGEPTVGYAEHNISVINRYRFTEGRLRGLVVGLSSSLRLDFRTYAYTDASDGGKRKIFFYPDRLNNDLFALHSVKLWGRTRATLQLNVANLFDVNKVVFRPRSTDGVIRVATYMNAPRKVTLTASVAY